jgi:hypothetical protein
MKILQLILVVILIMKLCVFDEDKQAVVGICTHKVFYSVVVNDSHEHTKTKQNKN